MTEHLGISHSTLEKRGSTVYFGRVKTLNGHFDGKVIVLDEATDLKPNTKVKVIPAMEGSDVDLTNEFAALSGPVFKKIWDNPLDADYDNL